MAGESELRRTFYLFGSLALIGGLLYWARPVMIPVTLAVLTTFVLAPMVTLLERRGVPRVVASVLALGSATVLLIAIGHILVQQMGPLADELPSFKKQIANKMGDLRQAAADSWLGDLTDIANNLGKNANADRPDTDQKDDTIAAKIEIPVVAVLQSVAGTAADILFSAVLVLVLALLMLIRREDLRNRVIHLLGSDNRVTVTRALDDASKRVSRFLFSQLLINLGFGFVVAVGLYFIGIPYPYVWGALAALLRYVPFFGGWVAASFPLIASLVMPTWTPFFITAGFFLVMELLQANLVEPLVFGHSIGVSGAGQVVAMFVWALLWGPVGLILSTPLTACLCVLGHHFPGLRFFATLMGDDEIIEKPDAFYQRLLAGDTVEASLVAESYLKENSIADLVDEVMIPALVAARSDQRNGELTTEDRISITEGVREVFYDVGSVDENPDESMRNSRSPHQAQVLVMQFPFNDEMDDLVIDMLRVCVASEHLRWSTAAVGNGSLEEIAQRPEIAPKLIVVSTSARKNLARIRGACKMVRRFFPDAELLVGCWCVDSEADAKSPRLKDAGASAVCTSFRQAQQIIDAAAKEKRQATKSPAVAV